MRTDIKVVNRPVKLPYDNILKMGRYKMEACKGDIIGYKGFPNGIVSIGRVVGKILDKSEYEDRHNCNGYICCVVISEDMSFTMERWIDPVDVLFCYDPNRPLFGSMKLVNLYANFFGAEFRNVSADKLREWSVSGFTHWDDSSDNYEECKKRDGVEFGL
jgi:hypothetical protein